MSRGRTKQRLLWRNEQKLPKVEDYQEEARKRKVGKKEKVEEECIERQVRNEIAQEVVAGIKKKANGHEDANPTAQRPWEIVKRKLRLLTK